MQDDEPLLGAGAKGLLSGLKRVADKVAEATQKPKPEPERPLTPEEEAAKLEQIRLEREQKAEAFQREEQAIRAISAGALGRIQRWYKFSDARQVWKKTGDGWMTVDMSLNIYFERSYAAMNYREREIYKYAKLFFHHGCVHQKQFERWEVAFAYNNGHSPTLVEDFKVKVAYAEAFGAHEQRGAVAIAMRALGADDLESIIQEIFRQLTGVAKDNPNHPLVKEFMNRLVGGSNWLTTAEFDGSPFKAEFGAERLFIGSNDQGGNAWFDSEGSIISIAPPGSGKTQCHVLPNLLHYRGPALVLDVKGECYDQTAGWRAANVGPVFRFNPLQIETSARYNPLAFLPTEPEFLWEDCRLLADLLIVPENHHDPSWENRARNVVTGALAWLMLFNPPEKRSIGRVVDVVSKIGWERFVNECRLSELRPLSRLGHSLQDMPEKQLEGVLDAARRHLAVWEGERVERVTSESDWSPEMFRDGSNPTLYVCIPPNEIESYAPLLRVIFAQHIRYLLRSLPPREQTPILFMMDELPRLGPMRPIEEALEVGRQYGIRLWLFAQSLGQLQRAYQNADGMIGSCALRIFMNPSSHDGTAKRLSDELGFSESFIDGSRQPMMETTALTGPEFAEFQLAFARNTKPAKFGKVYAFQHPELSERLGMPMPQSEASL